MAKYRKKPVVIEAEKFTNETKDRVLRWVGASAYASYENGKIPVIKIDTREGVMTGCFGDFIIKGIQGEFYPCKPDIFEATYEEVTD